MPQHPRPLIPPPHYLKGSGRFLNRRGHRDQTKRGGRSFGSSFGCGWRVLLGDESSALRPQQCRSSIKNLGCAPRWKAPSAKLGVAHSRAGWARSGRPTSSGARVITCHGSSRKPYLVIWPAEFYPAQETVKGSLKAGSIISGTYISNGRLNGEKVVFGLKLGEFRSNQLHYLVRLVPAAQRSLQSSLILIRAEEEKRT